ncbi:hypothetical protein GOV03_04220, partial [Candidatus Woesearchaeota archaeon]|nr:hypothetical protein [Candidatus Woesearchaeota archaeon]
DIGGLKVENAVLTYDLSQVTEVTLYWDLRRDGSCHSCLELARDYDAQEWDCNKQNPMKWKNCPQYNAKLKNSEGKTARTLAELIAEAAK